MHAGARLGEERRETLAWTVAVVATLAVFRLTGTIVRRLADLPASAYEGRAFVDDLFVRWGEILHARAPLVIALGAALAVLAVLLARRGLVRRIVAPLAAGWASLDDGRALRRLTLGVTAITTWVLASYARNLYVGQDHLVERLVLVALWLAIAWRPLFVFPYAVLAAAIAGQFTVPLGFISWTEMGVLLHFPVLLGAFWLVRAASGDRRIAPFVFAWCCVVAVTYFTSGVGKLRVGWLSHPHVPLLMAGAHANGWLADVGADAMARAVRFVERLTTPMMLGTLVVELGALVLLFRRWTLVGFLALAIVFHATVAAMTGIVFWKWIAADAALLAFLLGGDRLRRLSLFTPARFALSLLVIAAAPLWIRAENLTWFDTPLTYRMRYEGIDARGRHVELPAGFFRPYSDAIVLATFPHLVPHPQLTRAMGVTPSREVASALVAARTGDEALAIESRFGVVRHDSAAAAAFDDFVRRVAMRGRCDAERDQALLRLLGAPRHLWTMPVRAALRCGTTLAHVRVVEETTFYDGRTIRVVRRVVVRELDLAPGRAP